MTGYEDEYRIPPPVVPLATKPNHSAAKRKRPEQDVSTMMSGAISDGPTSLDVAGITPAKTVEVEGL